MRELEERAFKSGVSAEELMEKAGERIARAILLRYPVAGTVIACIGSGNNGGDALVAARYLTECGWRVSVRCAVDKNKLGALPRKKWRELGADSQVTIAGGKTILLDGLLGLGAGGELREPIKSSAVWINTQRESGVADVVSMDIPSGLDADSGRSYSGAVVADLTLTVGVPKCGLLMPEAANYVGAVETVPLAELPIPADGGLFLNDRESVRGLLPRRAHDFHKGDAGRVAIVAGSLGMLGAAVLCSTAALRAGAGLVSLFVDEEVYSMVVGMVLPEVMVRPYQSLRDVDLSGFDAVAIGPGLGLGEDPAQRAYLEMLGGLCVPAVIDADGLNRLSSAGAVSQLRRGMVVTPHPGEMKRLLGGAVGGARLEMVKRFVRSHSGVVLLLKGARSLVASSEAAIYVNGSGHAGMASAGQGDVLTGVIVGLMAQGLDGFEAARMGAWLCGRAAEMAVQVGGISEQSLIASDVIARLGACFQEVN